MTWSREASLAGARASALARAKGIRNLESRINRGSKKQKFNRVMRRLKNVIKNLSPDVRLEKQLQKYSNMQGFKIPISEFKKRENQVRNAELRIKKLQKRYPGFSKKSGGR